MLKIGTTSIIRLYFTQRIYVYNNSFIGPTLPVNYYPEGDSCDTLNTAVSFDGSKYECVDVNTEMLECKLGTTTVHKRVTLTFDDNGGSSGDTYQTRTWEVENVTQPSNPSRAGYTFLGWATTSGATSPNVTFPFLAPSTNVIYYAVWQLNQPPTAAPTIEEASTTFFRYKVYNADASTATIYANHNQPNPTTSRGSIVSGGSTTTINTGVSTIPGNDVTIYAKAQASGKTMSTVISVYWSR